MERAREYKMPLVIAFIDFEKAFDSVEINAVLPALRNQGICSKYTKLLKECNEGCSTEIALFRNPIRIPISKGVKQGDTISPKLFTATLEEVIRKLN